MALGNVLHRWLELNVVWYEVSMAARYLMLILAGQSPLSERPRVIFLSFILWELGGGGVWIHKNRNFLCSSQLLRSEESKNML